MAHTVLHSHRHRRRGHFAKMVHNGIEYADMQLIAEAYDLLRRDAGLTPAEIGRPSANGTRVTCSRSRSPPRCWHRWTSAIGKQPVRRW